MRFYLYRPDQTVAEFEAPAVRVRELSDSLSDFRIWADRLGKFHSYRDGKWEYGSDPLPHAILLVGTSGGSGLKLHVDDEHPR